jgi:hypothetical protein
MADRFSHHAAQGMFDDGKRLPCPEYARDDVNCQGFAQHEHGHFRGEEPISPQYTVRATAFTRASNDRSSVIRIDARGLSESALK